MHAGARKGVLDGQRSETGIGRSPLLLPPSSLRMSVELADLGPPQQEGSGVPTSEPPGPSRCYRIFVQLCEDVLHLFNYVKCAAVLPCLSKTPDLASRNLMAKREGGGIGGPSGQGD